VAIRTPFVQNKLVKTVAERLSEQLGTEVSVERIGISFPDYAVLSGVLIRDLNGDSMVHIKKFKVSLDQFKTDEQLLVLSKVHLETPKIYFHKPEDGRFNYLEHISKLGGTKSSGPSKPWTIKFGELRISDGSFQFHNENIEEPQSRAFKDNNLRFTGIQFYAKDFDLVNDSMHFDLVNLAALEASGFEIKKMNAEAQIYSGGISFKKLRLETANSIIQDEFSMTTRNYMAYAHFVDSVYMSSN
jgi:hypothetical protein